MEPHPNYATILVYVVTLKRRADRRVLFLSQIPKGVGLTLSYDIGGHYDHQEFKGANLPRFDLFPWRIESDNKWWSRQMTGGEVACALNHLACWQHAANAGAAAAVFFEDDAKFSIELFAQLPALLSQLDGYDAHWDLLYLGRENLGGDKPFRGPFVRPGFSYCTYGYALSNGGLHKLLAYRLRELMMPLDEFIIATHSPHPRPDVRARITASVSAYALREELVVELDDSVYGSDTEQGGPWTGET